MASATTIIQGDVYVNGNLAGKTQTLPANSVGNAQVASLAGIAASKLQHQYDPVYRQESTAAAAVGRQVLHVVYGATAQILAFRVGAVAAATGNATATIDLKKNGASILTATITLDSTTAAYVLKTPAGFTSTALVAGDVLEAHVTAVNAGTGVLAAGLFAQLLLAEDAQ